MITENVYLKELDLSHNAFREQGGVVIASALYSNTTLEKLDLSWNHLRRAGAVAIAKLLQVNRTLTHLNIAWNGFATEGCNYLSETLPKNTTLKEIDLTCNRIDRACLTTLLRGVGRNTGLESLKLSQNPITTEGAMAILSTIEQSPSLPVKFLDITGQCVSTNFLDKLAVLEAGRQLKAHHGYVLTDKEGGKDQDDFLNEDPMMVLMEFMRLRNLRLVDLFTSLDTDGSNTLTRNEFREGLLQVNVPMSSAALDRLIDKLDEDGDGEVDFAELMAGQKEHKRRVLRMTKEAKEKHIPYEDTDVGRLTKKLKSILAFKAAKAAALAAKAVTKMKKKQQERKEKEAE